MAKKFPSYRLWRLRCFRERLDGLQRCGERSRSHHQYRDEGKADNISTSVLPTPLAPAIEVISPYRKPPCSTLSRVLQPIDEGAGAGFWFERAVARRAEPRIGDAALAIIKVG